MTVSRGAIVLALCAAGCRQLLGFETPQAIDDAPSDAGPCEVLEATCADPATLRTCTTIGVPPTDTTCPWGCVDTPHCGRLVPAGGGAAAVDVDPGMFLGLVDFDLDGSVNGETGQINGASPVGVVYELKNGIGLFRFKRLTIPVGGVVALVGSKPIVLIADEEILIAGRIDAQGCQSLGAAIAGGFAGGTSPGQSGLGPGGGHGAAGGGGGGHGGHGGSGVDGSGGAMFGQPTLPMLFGGGGGGAGMGGGNFGRGGGGGGAIQLVSNTTITITASGEINAGGCGGSGGGGGLDGGGGGGAGGMILFEAPTVTVDGVLAVNGGGGGGAGAGSIAGAAGTPSRVPANGGTGTSNGGAGSGGGSVDGGPANPSGGSNGGGGGGAGWIRINTTSGSVSVAGVMSPNLDDDATAIVGKASVE